MRDKAARIAVTGSVNLDLAVHVKRLPRAGETVSNGMLRRSPGGKGANQALAARRLGAEVSLLACVGNDPVADEALALLRTAGVDLSRVAVDPEAATGVALIAVDENGENQIAVAPGANRCLSIERLSVPATDALICQLEVPIDTLLHIARNFGGFLCINLAPVVDIPDALLQRADLIVVNAGEAAYYGNRVTHARGFVATTHGSDEAELHRDGRMIAKARPPAVKSVDTTGAGDCFTAALTLGLVEGQDPAAALAFACAAAAASTEGHGTQTAMPSRATVRELLSR
ncbi:MAG: ribokinase [Halioglobus sp.]|nr:ribokinase [Halioglobus sp.]